MTPYYTDDWLTVWQGDCREVMAQMPAESVHTVVTSPPYWGLRDYGTATWIGGDEGCDHKSGRFTRGGLSSKQASNNGSAGDEASRVCGKCGAVRQDSQLGLEPTPEEYVANMVAVFREVRRVLRADGTCWVNLGDSYASTAPGTRNSPAVLAGSGAHARAQMRPETPVGLKPKDLVGIPWRVAFALQADGWYLRSDVIWSKPNPMPESVTDRPTKAHEYLFLLSKSPRYYYDADAVREPLEAWALVDGRMVNQRGGQGYSVDRDRVKRPAANVLTGNMAPGEHITPNPAGRNLRSRPGDGTEPGDTPVSLFFRRYCWTGC